MLAASAKTTAKLFMVGFFEAALIRSKQQLQQLRETMRADRATKSNMHEYPTNCRFECIRTTSNRKSKLHRAWVRKGPVLSTRFTLVSLNGAIQIECINRVILCKMILSTRIHHGFD